MVRQQVVKPMTVLFNFVEIVLADLAPPLGHSWKTGTLQYLIRFAKIDTSQSPLLDHVRRNCSFLIYISPGIHVFVIMALFYMVRTGRRNSFTVLNEACCILGFTHDVPNIQNDNLPAVRVVNWTPLKNISKAGVESSSLVCLKEHKSNRPSPFLRQAPSTLHKK